MGWDGDAVAEQLEKISERAEAAQEKDIQVNLTAEERARRAQLESQLESLRMSIARTKEQLDRAINPAHREMLKRALTSLEQQMEEQIATSPELAIGRGAS
jgi:LPS O-antigen subunit length determinant protein (WzzB/FepE family)